ncbi:L,D-transpeptidase [Saliniramus sp.]|uniref:L,D-transpeptidase n=1 Tax=Saliniramus sp. TaxID=2986772 RepID=UPI002D0D9037|nr:L,D-transpeptidase [Saliniramus sp.]HMB12343.1 L,D-transpeptidase [Saliniramus sp.]
MQLLRFLAVITVSLGLAGCFQSVPDPEVSARDAQFMALVPDSPLEPKFQRYKVDYRGTEEPGTVVVDTRSRLLYLVLEENKAIRYGVAVGDEAYGWTGTARIARRAEWPSWNPTQSMRERWPHVRSMQGGPMNPMGARALYLYEGNRDTLYRIHGTNEPESIGRAASSGCIRMRNIDVIDLYNRVQVGARVVVR